MTYQLFFNTYSKGWQGYPQKRMNRLFYIACR